MLIYQRRGAWGYPPPYIWRHMHTYGEFRGVFNQLLVNKENGERQAKQIK